MEKIRSLVRPLVTMIGMLTVSYLVLKGQDVPSQYGLMLDGILAWWFWDRTKRQ